MIVTEHSMNLQYKDVFSDFTLSQSFKGTYSNFSPIEEPELLERILAYNEGKLYLKQSQALRET